MPDTTVIAVVGIVVGAVSPVLTLAVNGYINSRMESKKALLARGSSLYERRADVIVSLYGLLRDTETLFQQIARPVVFKGEVPREDIAIKAIQAYHDFAFEFLHKRILLPATLSAHTEEILKALSQAGLQYSYATDPTFPSGQSRADDFATVQKIVRERVPALLTDFEKECRAILEPKTASA
jgi:hypothetical protein